MKTFAKSILRLAAVGLVVSGITTSFAQKPDKTQITEKDKEVYRKLMDLLKKQRDAQKNRYLQVVAVKLPDHLEKCAFSYMIGMNAAANPSRPVVVAPLLKGKEIFDPVALGGKAVVLRMDNSVQSFPIDEDGRVMINGKDIFDPAQPFWNGKVPEIRWSKD